MFITHLAMAGKRAEEGTEENPIDEAILQGMKEEEAYEQAIVLRDQFLSFLPSFPLLHPNPLLRLLLPLPPIPPL